MYGKILVVDEEQGLIDYLATYFLRQGYEIITVRDGNEVEKTMQKEKETEICFAMIEKNMWPGEYAVKRIIQRYHPELPVLMMSGKDYPARRSNLLHKPFTRKQMNDRIKKLIPDWSA